MKKIVLSLTIGVMTFFAPVVALANDPSKALTTTIYDKPASDDPFAGALLSIVKWVGGIGGIAFTLAILVIALFIIFGSISAAKMRTVWISLISCVAGAILFFAAYNLAPAIAKLAQ